MMQTAERTRFTEAEMATVRDTDLPDLLISLGYQVKRIGRYYTTQEMDSIRIKDRRTWFRYSEGIGGDAITFLQRFYNKSFPEAVEYLLTWHGRARDSPPVSTPRQTKEKEEKVPFMELMNALFRVAQGAISTIMDASGMTAMSPTTLPEELITAIESVGLLESIPLWAVTLLGSLFIWVLSLVMILTVYSRFFKLYMATAIAPIPLASFAGQPSSSIGVAFLKSYAAICLEGCIIVLACVIFSQFASAPPAVGDASTAPATLVWNYIGELIFNMLVLVGSIKMSDRIIRELMGLG